MSPSALFPLLLFGPIGARTAPPMVVASADALQACPGDAIEAWRDPLRSRLSRPAREAAVLGYERAVADWAVCASVHGFGAWSTPPIDDPASVALVRAARAGPGTQARFEAVLAVEALARDPSVRPALGGLALQELAVLPLVAKGPAHQRMGLVAAALGPWACPGAVEWMAGPDGRPLGFCLELASVDVVAEQALANLGQLVGPVLGGEHWLVGALKPVADRIMPGAAAVALPLPFSPPVAPVQVSGPAVDLALPPPPGWALLIDGQGLGWMGRPTLRFSGAGLVQEGAPFQRGEEPPPMVRPWVFVDPSLPLSTVAEGLAQAQVREPQFVLATEHGPRALPIAYLEAQELPDGWALVPVESPFSVFAEQVHRQARQTGKRVAADLERWALAPAP